MQRQTVTHCLENTFMSFELYVVEYAALAFKERKMVVENTKLNRHCRLWFSTNVNQMKVKVIRCNIFDLSLL